MRISDWSSDVCSSDLLDAPVARRAQIVDIGKAAIGQGDGLLYASPVDAEGGQRQAKPPIGQSRLHPRLVAPERIGAIAVRRGGAAQCGEIGRATVRRHRSIGSPARSEEHTSELQSLMRISYAVFCLTQKKALMP